MKLLYAMTLCAALLAGTSVAATGTGSLNDFTPRILPVLVRVNTHGKVTEASPSTKLAPQLRRLLLKNLNEWITGPAIVHDKPVSSQFVMNVALEVSPRSQGDYYANFTYVSTSPVPPGSWYWVHIDGHRLALANRNGFPDARRPHFNHRQRPVYAPPRRPFPYRQPVPNISRGVRATSRSHGH